MRSELVLRVGLVHGGRVLDERLVRSGDVTVGTDPTCTLVLPAGEGAPKRRQIVAWPKSRAPRLVAQGLDGRVAAGTAPVEPPAAVTPLVAGHRGKLVLGPSVVLFQCLAADDLAPLRAAPRPRLRRRGRPLDWPLLQALVVSAVLLGGSGGGLAAWWHETGRYYDDVLSQERVAEQLVVAEVAARIERAKPQLPEEPTPEAPAQAEVPVAAAPVVEAAKPIPTAPRDRTRDRVTKRTKAPTAGSVRDKTFLSVLGTPDAEGTVAGLTQSAHVAAAFEDTDGGVTVAARDGVPGGPTAAPVAQRDRYVQVCADGACVGSPLTRRQVVTEKKGDDEEQKPRIRIRPATPDAPTGVGRVDPDAIKRVFRQRKGAISACYEKYLRGHGASDGVVKILFTITLAGRVDTVSAIGNTFGDAALADCITGKVKTWRFDPPVGGTVTLAYPLVLETH